MRLSAKVAVVQWLRMQVLGMEVPGSNFGKFFFNIFAHIYYPVVTALLEYLDPVILHLLSFCFITLSLYKRYCYDDQPIYTPIFKLFLYLVYPVAVTEVRSFFT